MEVVCRSVSIYSNRAGYYKSGVALCRDIAVFWMEAEMPTYYGGRWMEKYR